MERGKIYEFGSVRKTARPAAKPAVALAELPRRTGSDSMTTPSTLWHHGEPYLKCVVRYADLPAQNCEGALLSTLRDAGIPIQGNNAFSGVAQGILWQIHSRTHLTYYWRQT